MRELKELPEWFSKHPLTQKIIREDETATASKRKAVLLEMKTLETAFLTDRSLIGTSPSVAAAGGSGYPQGPEGLLLSLRNSMTFFHGGKNMAWTNLEYVKKFDRDGEVT